MPLIRYDEMDLANPPEGVKLEKCSNCERPGMLVIYKKCWVYVHTTYPDGKRREYCKVSIDGCKVEMVMSVLPMEEKRELPQDNPV